MVGALSRAAHEVEAAVQRGRVTATVRTTFQAVALAVRAERDRVGSDETVGAAKRADALKRLDRTGTLLARTAVRDAGLLALLSDDATVSAAARQRTRDLLGRSAPEVDPPEPVQAAVTAAPERQVVPQSVLSRQLANPFLAPDFSAARATPSRPRRLAGWELLEPLLRSFERAGAG